jgi:hypothetical protein
VFALRSEHGSLTDEGKYFSGENDEAYPNPVQAPRPVLINAGKCGVAGATKSSHASWIGGVGVTSPAESGL